MARRKTRYYDEDYRRGARWLGTMMAMVEREAPVRRTTDGTGAWVQAWIYVSVQDVKDLEQSDLD